jgi:hypothetical protein
MQHVRPGNRRARCDRVERAVTELTRSEHSCDWVLTWRDTIVVFTMANPPG